MKQTIALLFSWLLVLPALAEHTSTSFKITKEWNIEPNTAFELVANYQNYKVEIWDKETVRIDFVLNDGTGKMDEEDFKNSLKINAEKSSRKLKVTTNMNEQSSSIWSWLFNNKSKNDYTISNVLYLPKSIASVSFSLNYCELIIDEINFPVKINCNYCDVSVLKNNNRTSISTTYSDVKFGDINHLKISSSYSDFNLNTIDTLSITSSYGDIVLTNCSLLQSLNINYGDIMIGKVDYITAKSTYSDIKINQVIREVNATLTYSDMKLSNLSKSLNGISIISLYSDTEIKINPENPVTLTVTDTDGDILIKNSQLIVTKKQEKSNTTELRLKTKSATETAPIIKINSKYSDLIIN